MSFEKRPIDSVNLESEILQNLSQRRGSLESEYVKSRVANVKKSSKKRILELASRGELGIAKSLALEQLETDPKREVFLETMALLETYDYDDRESFLWNNSLIDAFPENEIGLMLEKMRFANNSREWELARNSSIAILGVDAMNWFALEVSAKANAALGDWENSSKNWEIILSLRNLTDEEVFEAGRSAYNSRNFSRVVEIVPDSKSIEKSSEKVLKLLIRANYNLRRDEESLEQSARLLQLEPKSEIGLRYYSRGLIRKGLLHQVIPILEDYCRVCPFSVDAWESLIEVQLMMDKEIEASETWKKLRSQISGESMSFLCALEISLKFNWREEYLSLIENEGVEQSHNSDFAEDIAEIHFRLGEIGSAWRFLSSNGVDPMKSNLSEEFCKVFEITNTGSREVDSLVGLEDPLWIAELVTREILRKAEPRRKIRKSRRVCHLITSSLDRGGAERQVAMTLKYIQGLGDIECYLVAHRVKNRQGSGSYFDDLLDYHDKIIDLENISEQYQNLSGKKVIERYAELLGLLDSTVKNKTEQLILHLSEHRPDVVHAWQDETILTACLAGALTGVPVIIGSARSMSPDKKTGLHIRKRPYLRNCFKEIFNYNFHHLTTNSVAGRESYAEWIGIDSEKIEVNENGVDFDGIEGRMNLLDVENMMEEFGFSESNKIVGGLFRLEAGKRPDLWIEAFEVARKIDPNLRGVIVGGGRMEAAVRKWVMDSRLDDFVKVVGEVKDVGSWLSVIDIFLFTSASEGLPNVLIEAQGFGVPVVSTRVGGVSEIVINGETGLLVNSTSSVDLGKAIIEFLNNHDSEENRGMTKENARKRFSVLEMSARTIEMYSRVMSLEKITSSGGRQK